MILDAGSIFLYLGGFFILYLLCWLFIKPIKWLLRLGLSSLLGGVGILLFNLLFKWSGLYIALNPLTCLITGVLGIPGMSLISILSKVL